MNCITQSCIALFNDLLPRHFNEYNLTLILSKSYFFFHINVINLWISTDLFSILYFRLLKVAQKDAFLYPQLVFKWIYRYKYITVHIFCFYIIVRHPIFSSLGCQQGVFFVFVCHACQCQNWFSFSSMDGIGTDDMNTLASASYAVRGFSRDFLWGPSIWQIFWCSQGELTRLGILKKLRI